MHKTRIFLDAHGFYYVLTVYPSSHTAKGIPLACYTLCGWDLRRPHLTCLHCRIRKVWYGKMKEKTPVDVIIVTVAKKQRYKNLKAAIRKVLFTLAGWTFN